MSTVTQQGTIGAATAQVLEGKGLILSVLERASQEGAFMARLSENPAAALDEYYTLTMEEKAAIAAGDIKKIESWVGKLSAQQAAWLWSRLSQEKW